MALSTADREKLSTWSQSHDHCAACWIPEQTAFRVHWPGLQTHHLVKRSRKTCHEGWNLLRLCRQCHQLAELDQIRVDGVLLPKLFFGHCLEIKRTANSDEWEPDLLEEAYGRGLPDLLPLPDEMEAERLKWHPFNNAWRGN